MGKLIGTPLHDLFQYVVYGLGIVVRPRTETGSAVVTHQLHNSLLKVTFECTCVVSQWPHQMIRRCPEKSTQTRRRLPRRAADEPQMTFRLVRPAFARRSLADGENTQQS